MPELVVRTYQGIILYGPFGTGLVHTVPYGVLFLRPISYFLTVCTVPFPRAWIKVGS